jgi:methionyl-tRNA formyltransferase
VAGETTAAPAGTVIEAAGDRLMVAAGDGGVIRILQIQPEGKRVLTAAEFLAGRRIPAGARFTRA